MVHVHILSEAGGQRVLLLDATEEANHRRLLQQRGNELALLRDQLERQNRDLEAANEQIQSRNEQLAVEKAKSERLLLSIFPALVAEQLKEQPRIIADSFAHATVLFADVNDFSGLSAGKTPIQVVEWLREVFSAFDRLADAHGLEKIKTIGDCYMVVGGVPNPRPDHAEAVAHLALDMQREIGSFDSGTGEPVQLQIGINSGPVLAGVIGTAKLAYDLWGETVNVAAEMETHGLPGCIQVAEATYALLKETYLFEDRGEFYIKGRGAVATYLLTGRRPGS